MQIPICDLVLLMNIGYLSYTTLAKNAVTYREKFVEIKMSNRQEYYKIDKNVFFIC